MKCVSLEMLFHLADVTHASEITVKVLHLQVFVQVFSFSSPPSCPFGFEEYVWIRELECFGKYQNQQHKKCHQMHFVIMGKNC